MVRQSSPREGQTGTPPPRPCGVCGGAMRFSHREQTRRGAAVVLRCVGCGATLKHAAGSDDDAPRMTSRKPPIDEGPPENRVIDPALAAQLLQGLKDDTSDPS